MIRRVEWTDIPQQMLSLFTVSIRRRHSLKILMIGARQCEDYQRGKEYFILEPVEYTRQMVLPVFPTISKKVFDVTQTNGRKAPAVSANRDPKALITTMLDVSPVEVAATDEHRIRIWQLFIIMKSRPCM